MMLAWDLWRSMPATKAGAPIEAPSGPGLYEVRRASNGEVVAFGHTDSVAQVLNKMVPSSSGGLLSLFSRASEAMRADLEYRTFAAASVEEARTIAARLNERRQAFYRRRMPVR